MNCKEWDWYEEGKSYNKRLEPNYYNMVDCNWDFFFGKQWRNADLYDDLPQPVFNNINRFVTFFVASIMASKPAVKFTAPVLKENEDIDSDVVVNSEWKEFEERVKLTFNAKNALYDGAVTGDYVAHLIFNPDSKPYGGTLSDVLGQIEFEKVDPNNFYVSNANSNDIQSQNYIQVAGRATIKDLKAESEEQQEIQSDTDTEEQASSYGRIEVEGEDSEKATYVITYVKKKVKDKETGKEVTRVFATKCTQTAYIYKNIDIGIPLYPVALGNWELQRNTYHGMSFVTAAIPTQIYINRGFAMAMWNTLQTAFQKLVYNKDKISGFTDMVGGQLGVNLLPGESLGNVAQYLAPGNMSPQVMQMIDMAQQYMKETVGANDALLGNINPEAASGVSIATASKQAGIPLENPRANLYNWYEDIARIFYSMISNLYGNRPVIITEGEETKVIEYDFDELQNLYKSITVDVGPSSYWSELAVIQTLDNLLDRNLIDFMEYLERIPEGYIIDKQGLLNRIKEKLEEQQQERPEQTDRDLFLAALSEEERQKFLSLTPEQQEQLFLQGGV